MGVLPNPISGGDELTNSAGIDDRWSCPNCYEDHTGASDGERVKCKCGATLLLHVDMVPVCRAEAVAFEESSS
jgi:hypothetical protein